MQPPTGLDQKTDQPIRAATFAVIVQHGGSDRNAEDGEPGDHQCHRR